LGDERRERREVNVGNAQIWHRWYLRPLAGYWLGKFRSRTFFTLEKNEEG
jgi:hypothetical protein